ncbi:syntaxin-8 [Anoplophora glabripennis]|nr:syntaxin-8 [Anoplophora glabripennis]
MALLFLEEDPWLTEYESCEKLYRDIMEQLTFRQQHSRTSNTYSQISANVRLRLKQFNNEVGQLNQKLEVITKSGNITLAESERRTRQIEVLHSKAIQMKKIFEEQVISKLNEDRHQIIGPSTSEWASSGDERVNNTFSSVTDLKTNQKKMLEEQERGLENLSDVISRQKNIAHTISSEVDFHNEILDGLGNQMEQTNERVRTETRHIDVVGNTDKTCIYWVVIILLFISIIAVAVI